MSTDGSISMAMPKNAHEELMKVIKSSIDQSLNELVEAEDTPYIRRISANDGYTAVTVYVDRESYESAVDMTPLKIDVSAMMYQQYDGTDPHCAVMIRDCDSGEILRTVVYPDEKNGQKSESD